MELLNKIVDKWKETSEYEDVDAAFLNAPSNNQMPERCPDGCALLVYESENGGSPWREMQGYPDHFRQTRICRKHGYARIYVTTGLNALGVKFNLK